jgi:hypothetical protein
MPVEDLLLSDRDHIYQCSVGIRRDARTRLGRKIDEEAHLLGFGSLSLAVASEAPSCIQNSNSGNRDREIPYYLGFPYLFYELYSEVPLDQYDKLALSQQLYLNHVLIFDSLMDGKLLLEPQIAYWANSTYQKILLILHQLFPIDSPFWNYFEKCRVENTQAFMVERIKHTYRVSPYSEQEKVLIFSGKSAMARAGLAALAYLSQRDFLEDVALSCDAFHIGLQCMDDVQDWRNDYRDHVYTPLLTEVLLEHHLDEKAESDQRPDVNSIGSLVYGGGYAQKALESAIDYFNLALYVSKDLKCPAWQSEILNMIARCKQNRAFLDQKLRQMKEKRTPQMATQKAQFGPKLADIFVLSSSSVQQMPEAWIKGLCQSGGFSCPAFDLGDQLVNNSTEEGDALWIENAREILKRCESFVSSPPGMQVWLCDIPRLPASLSFEHEKRWQVVLNRAAFSTGRENLLQECQEHLAYQYGRVARLYHSSNPQSFLDEMCVKGFGMAFVKKTLPDLGQSAYLLPKRLDWFERNKHYLWQEIQPYLSLSTSFNLNAAMKFENMDTLLSYDLIASYCQRMGNEALRQGVQASAEDILDKSYVLAIVNRITGAN